MRVTDETVRTWLTWARNFEEVVAYRIGTGKARRFRVRVPPGVTCNGHPFREKQGMLDITGHAPEDVVPPELMFTAREALAFAMGCATARAAAFAGSERTWLPEWPEEDRAVFVRCREEAREANAAELAAESAEFEADRQRRVAEYRRRKEGVRQIEGDR